MNLEEIKAAVDAGHTVCWMGPSYTVQKWKAGYMVVHASGSAIGLTWADGVTLNGSGYEFYIKGEQK